MTALKFQTEGGGRHQKSTASLRGQMYVTMRKMTMTEQKKKKRTANTIIHTKPAFRKQIETQIEEVKIVTRFSWPDKTVQSVRQHCL